MVVTDLIQVKKSPLLKRAWLVRCSALSCYCALSQLEQMECHHQNPSAAHCIVVELAVVLVEALFVVVAARYIAVGLVVVVADIVAVELVVAVVVDYQCVQNLTLHRESQLIESARFVHRKI